MHVRAVVMSCAVRSAHARCGVVVSDSALDPRPLRFGVCRVTSKNSPLVGDVTLAGQLQEAQTWWYQHYPCPLVAWNGQQRGVVTKDRGRVFVSRTPMLHYTWRPGCPKFDSAEST